MYRDFNSPEYKRWRQQVYTRDKFCCRWPNCQNNKKLNAHHIKTWAHYPGLRFDVNNGITLCKEHHKMIQGMEDIYEATFFRILANDRFQ
jgi:hypothetical protein